MVNKLDLINRKKQFIEKAKKVHGNTYDYSKVDYINCKTRIIIVCSKHNEFWQVPSEHLRKHGCPQCGRDRIKKIWDNNKKRKMSEHKRAFFYNNRNEISEQFIKKAREIHGDKYNYSKVDYINCKIKVIIICPKHGEFHQIPDSHMGGSGCPSCAIQRSQDIHILTTNEFIKKAREIHNSKYDYSKVNYIGTRAKVIIICLKHGEFQQIPNCHLSGNGCPKCVGTKLQNEIGDFVDLIELGSNYNDRIQIKPYELDIYIPEKRIAIEFNGLYWHSYGERETHEERNKHSFKCDLCAKKGIRLIQVSEYEWLNKQEIVKSILKSKLGVSNRIYARKCELKEISSREHIDFMDQNHIQGGKGCKVAYGLCYQDELVAIMSFNKHSKYEWEITRFANKLDTTVVGGASKLFKHFLRTKNPNQILTYADRRYSDGNLYKKLGFKLNGITSPNYIYVKNGEIHSRQQFQKHKLKDKLESFDSALTESENMFNNGYRRLWDAGNYRFLWK